MAMFYEYYRVDLLTSGVQHASVLRYAEIKLSAWKVKPKVYLNSSTLMLFPSQVK